MTTSPSIPDSLNAPGNPAEAPKRGTTPVRGSAAVLAVLCTAQALDIMNLSSVNMALPAMARDWHASPGQLSWVVSAYSLMFAGFLLVAGRAADLYGRRRALLGGMAVFAAASAVVWASPSLLLAVAARAVQGAGAAVTVSAALGLIGALWREEPGRSRALGAFGAMGGVGLAFGLVVGGALAGSVGWRAMFAVNVLVVVVLVVAVLALIPADDPGDRARGRLDLPGAALATGGLLGLSFASTRLGGDAADPAGWAAAVAAAALLAGFALRQRRVAEPLVPPAVWRRPNLAAALAVAVFMYAGWVGVNYFAALLLQNVLGFGPLATGAAFLPLAVGGTLLPLVAGRLVPRVGVRRLMLFGLSCSTVGLALFALVGPGADYWLVVLPILVVLIVGLSQTFVPANITALSGAGSGEQALAGAMFNTALQVGGGLGLAVLSTVATTADDVLTGYRAAFLTAAGLSLAGLITVLAGIRDPRRPSR
ncbi:MFS transporter [Kitasatospora sp. NPDC096077]|uniref:MFS transporter n=1 Tax=Kitasatospora sp. NPDC096077 TaxID=3155544 RepID=UPI0033289155